jgi:signal transduction histidine kinase
METESKCNALTELFPGIAVQLRTALGTLHLAISALASPKMREEDPELDAKAAILDQSYYQLLRLSENLTNTGLMVRNRPLPLKNQNLVGLVQGFCERCAPLVEIAGLRFSFQCEESELVCAICWDALEQALYQLLSNAMKYAGADGTITVELKQTKSQVLLSVKDTGCGMESTHLETLFDRYAHDGQVEPSPHGFGLGLLLCRQIAAGHGGSILAESKPDEGTTVTLQIPLQKVKQMGVSDVPIDYGGGFDKTLLGLSDALPATAFLRGSRKK